MLNTRQCYLFGNSDEQRKCDDDKEVVDDSDCSHNDMDDLKHTVTEQVQIR